MNERYEELVKACKEGHLYDFIASEGYRFDKQELIDIIKNLDYAIYQRLGDQCQEVEQLVPNCLDEYEFFGDTTAEEKAYFRYLSGEYTYQDYIDVCELEEIEQPRARKQSSFLNKKIKIFTGVCPFCGSGNYDFVDTTDDDTKYVCRNCNEDFLVDNKTDECADRHNRLILLEEEE